MALTTLAEARTLTSPAFVKPPNDKSLPAAVYEPSQLPEGFDPEMPVLVAEPVSFVSEFRCFVLRREVRSHSLYARDGDPFQGDATPEEAAGLTDFVSRLLQDDSVDLPEACVLDCGPIRDRGWAAVELNAAWGAGLYDCDPAAALDVIRAATCALWGSCAARRRA